MKEEDEVFLTVTRQEQKKFFLTSKYETFFAGRTQRDQIGLLGKGLGDKCSCICSTKIGLF